MIWNSYKIVRRFAEFLINVQCYVAPVKQQLSTNSLLCHVFDAHLVIEFYLDGVRVANVVIQQFKTNFYLLRRFDACADEIRNSAGLSPIVRKCRICQAIHY